MKKIQIRQEQLPIEIMSTMGCRTQNGADVNALEKFKENIQSVLATGQLCNDCYSAAQKDGRGNICPVTIILPTLAMECKEAVGDDPDVLVPAFMNYLDKKIHEAKDMLLERFDYMCSQSPDSAKFMYENNTMAGYIPEEGIRSALRHGTLVVGQLGLAECLQILIGCDHTTDKGMELAKQIEQLYKDRCAEFKQQYSLNFGVYFTPEFLWAA